MPGRKQIFNALLLVFWIGASVAVLILLVAAIETRNAKPCSDLRIEIKGSKEAVYVDKADVKRRLTAVNGNVVGKSLKDIDLQRLEAELEEDPWISNAELFFDNKRVLQVTVNVREPLARVFTVTGNSFYIDTALFRIPLNDKFTPRLPVFTGFPSDRKRWVGKDSMLMADVKQISLYLSREPFWMAQIDQVDIDADRHFTMVPKVGKHLIRFGDGENVDRKFRKLYIFYRDVVSKTGWSRYAAVDVGFRGQIVATRKDVQAVKADTVLARQWMVQMIKNQKEQAMKDTLNTKKVTTTRLNEQL
jgi:cell division protein FtsQ